MKNKLPLIVAIIVGILAIVGIHSYVKKVEQNADARLKGEPVVAAGVDIPAGTELTLQMVKPKSVPTQFIPPQSIRGSAELKQILGRKTRIGIRAGQLILWSDLASESRGGLSSIIPAGDSAFSVSISKGVKSGLIQPSDHIDIIASFALPKPTDPLPKGSASWRQGSDMVNVVLLQNVTVLAIGSLMGVANSPTTGDGGELTLSLTLPESQLLMFAASHGELGAVLRREGSVEVKTHDELPKITFESIETIIGDLDGKRNVRAVEVQKGSKTETVPVNKSPLGTGGQQ